MILFPLLVAAAAASGGGEVAEPNPKAMTRAEIRAFNAKLPRTHPYYIRCIKSPAIGSLVAREVSCRTNAQWTEAERIGNQNAYETYDTFRPRGNPNGAGG